MKTTSTPKQAGAGAPELDIKQVFVTPEMAKQILLRNTKNRPLNEATVERYKEEMLNDRWKPNNDCIVISNKNRLLNGQHRLNAIERAGKGVWCILVNGVDDEAFDVIDTGKPRSLADILAIAGESETKRLSAALQLLAKYLTGNMRNRGFRLTAPAAEEVLKQHPDIVLSVAKIKEAGRVEMPSALAVAHYLFSQKDHELAQKWFDQYVTGVIPEAGHPVLLLRERIKEKSAGTRLDAGYVLALMIKSFVALRTKEWPKILRFAPAGERAEPMPEVV